MLEVLEIKADNNTVRIVELENKKISITDDIAQLKLDSALFKTIKDHIDYVVADATLKVKCDLTSTGIINGHQLNLAYGDYYIKSIPTVGDMGYIFLIGSDINDIVLLEWNPLDNTLNIKSSFITLDGDVNITGTTYLNKLKFGNQLDPITGVTYSFGSTINDNTIPTTQKVQNMIDAVSQFNPNDSTLTGTTTLSNIKFPTGSTINGFVNSTQNLNNDNTVPTSLRVKNMIDAIPLFNPNNSTLTGLTTINKGNIGGIIMKYTNMSNVWDIKMANQTNHFNRFYISTENIYDDLSILSSLKIKNMIDAIPVFNPNNLTLTGITSAEQFKLKYGGIIDTIVGTCDLMEINNESIFTTAMVMDLIEQSAFISDNTVLTGITTVSQIKMDKGGYTIKTMPTTGAPGEYNMRIECTTDNSFLIDWNNWDSTAIMKCNDLIFDGAVNNIGTTTLNSLKFGNQLTPINAVSYSTNTTIDDNTLATSKRAQNLAFPIGIIVKFISTQSISTLPGTWTRVGIWGTKSPIVLYSITIRTIYLGNTARVTFIPVNASTAASRTITFDQMGIINGATFYSDDFELVATNEYSFHDNQTKMTYSTNQFTVDRNIVRSWSVTFSFDPVSTYSYASSVQYEYQRTA